MVLGQPKNLQFSAVSREKAVAVSGEKIQEGSKGGADFPAANFLAGTCPNLGQHIFGAAGKSMSWKIDE